MGVHGEMLSCTEMYLLPLLILIPAVFPMDSDETAAGLASAVQKLLGMLQPSPPRGRPWPKIPGPRKQDSVCIVGAGPAGVHMALSLKQLNYSDVVVLEKSNRVGGTSYDIEYRGVPNPMGAIYLEANYFENLVPLAQQYGLGDIVKIPNNLGIWTSNSVEDPGAKQTFATFLLGTLSGITNSTSPQVNIGAFIEASIRYIGLHKEMFGTYSGDLMERPSPEVLHRTRGTFLEFLQRENLHIMIPIFQISHTAIGYGYLDEVSTLYGLIWNNPKLIVTLVLRALNKADDPFNIYVLKNGFEKLWRTIVKEEELNVVYNVDIVQVKKRYKSVVLKTWHNSKVMIKQCNFLIWTAPMSELLRVLINPSRRQVQLLSTLKPTTFSKSLVNSHGAVRNGPTSLFMKNILGKVNHGVTIQTDFAGLLIPGMATDPKVLREYNEEKDLTTRMCSQLGREDTNEEHLNRQLRKHYEGFNVTELEILSTKSWSYFPRWSPEEMTEGRHWEVFDMQGRDRIWFAGSSVSFESIRGVMEYNKLLLRQMEISRSEKPFTIWYHTTERGGI